MKHLSKHLNFANVISCVALFVALSGAAYAAKTTLGNKAVKTRNLANGSVNTLKLRNGAVTPLKIRNGAVTGAKIAPGAVGSTQILDGGIRSVDLGGGVVTESKLKNGAVTGDKLAANAVGKDKIASNAVETGKLAKEAVTADKVASGFYNQLIRNVSYETKESVSDPSDAKTAVAECPAGKEVIGGGAFILGAPNKVVISQSAPSPLNTENKRIGWIASAREVEAEGSNWSVQSFAICAEF